MGPRRVQLTTLAAGLGLAVGVAWGGEHLGVVKSVDPGQRTVVLPAGTQFWLAPGLSLDLFGQGIRVKVVYEDRDGKKWVRSSRRRVDGRRGPARQEDGG